jgi:hypothetical protein
MKVFAALFLSFILFSSFHQLNTLTGTWEYVGEVFNGKKEGAPTDYSLQRNYTATDYQAFVIEKGYEPEKYETGNYTLKADSCLETQTWCGQPSNLLNITLHYHYKVVNDTLIFNGILPTGALVTEYWKRVK